MLVLDSVPSQSHSIAIHSAFAVAALDSFVPFVDDSNWSLRCDSSTAIADDVAVMLTSMSSVTMGLPLRCVAFAGATGDTMKRNPCL